MAFTLPLVIFTVPLPELAVKVPLNVAFKFVEEISVMVMVPTDAPDDGEVNETLLPDASLYE